MSRPSTTINNEQDTNSLAQGLLIGKIIALSENGNPLIAFDEQTKGLPVEALTTVAIDASSIGKDVAISFAQNQGGMPIVMGVIRRLLDDVITQQQPGQVVEPSVNPEVDLSSAIDSTNKPEIIVDGNKIELSAPEEITLRCGKASITLNKNGKILLKGEHVLNRMAGAFKVKSGSVHLN